MTHGPLKEPFLSPFAAPVLSTPRALNLGRRACWLTPSSHRKQRGTRKTRKDRVPWHRGHYRKRHRIEHFFQRIKRFRRVGTRYEKHAVHFLAFVQLTAIMKWLKSPF
ncbi:MAG: transposase [Verrucomicrobiae bacterium]|nr:transposase [Verrucomicrobiae bacterium]